MNWEAFKKMTFKQKLFTIFVISPIFFLIILPLCKSISRKIEEKKMYKKVIKKGFFWDTEYLIEK